MRKTRSTDGFTIIEMTLVIAFLAVLVLGVVYIGIMAGKMYTKGASMKSLNQVGREVTDQVRRDVNVADPSKIKIVSPGSGSAGRLCLGSVSYVWNIAGTSLSASTQIKSQKDNKAISFVRALDAGGMLCESTPGIGYPTTIPQNIIYRELLTQSQISFVVYKVAIAELTSNVSSHGRLYSVDMTIGTDQEGTVTDEAGSTICRPPSDASANLDFCVVRSFESIVRAGGSDNVE